MSQSATPATRNEATTRLKPPKMDHLCRTSHRHGHTALARTVADGCGRLRTVATVANGCGRGRNVERTHPQPPDPQSETGTLATHSVVSWLMEFPLVQIYDALQESRMMGKRTSIAARISIQIWAPGLCKKSRKKTHSNMMWVCLKIYDCLVVWNHGILMNCMTFPSYWG